MGPINIYLESVKDIKEAIKDASKGDMKIAINIIIIFYDAHANEWLFSNGKMNYI